MRTFSLQSCSHCGGFFCERHIVWSPERARWEDRRCKKKLDARATLKRAA
jgi:hypothetical protein